MVFPRERVHGEPWRTFSTTSPLVDAYLYPLINIQGRFGWQINTAYRIFRRIPLLVVPGEEQQPVPIPVEPAQAEEPPQVEEPPQAQDPPQAQVPPEAEEPPQDGRRGPR